MSIESAKVLRNGQVSTNSSPQSPTKNTKLNLNPNMESSSNSADEINQSGRNSPTNENSTQRENEERFDRLHNEMAMLKAMMEKIISQNEERDKQNGGSTATSSYAVGTSNIRTRTIGTKKKPDISDKTKLNRFKLNLLNWSIKANMYGTRFI